MQRLLKDPILKPLLEDLCQWLGRILEIVITPDNFTGSIFIWFIFSMIWTLSTDTVSNLRTLSAECRASWSVPKFVVKGWGWLFAGVTKTNSQVLYRPGMISADWHWPYPRKLQKWAWSVLLWDSRLEQKLDHFKLDATSVCCFPTWLSVMIEFVVFSSSIRNLLSTFGCTTKFLWLEKFPFFRNS